MPGVIVTSSEFSVFERNMPSAADVTAAMRRYTPQRNPVLGAWVGPMPRVTRKPVIGGFETDVAWLYYWPDTDYSVQNSQTLQRNLHDQVRDGLAELSSAWSEPVLLRYSVALNGPTDWWSSGLAARTQTRDQAPTGAGRLDAAENPLGPTTVETHPSTVGQAASRAATGTAQAASSILNTPIVWVIAGSVLLFAAWPYVGPWLKRLEPSDAA